MGNNLVKQVNQNPLYKFRKFYLKCFNKALHKSQVLIFLYQKKSKGTAFKSHISLSCMDKPKKTF